MFKEGIMYGSPMYPPSIGPVKRQGQGFPLFESELAGDDKRKNIIVVPPSTRREAHIPLPKTQ